MTKNMITGIGGFVASHLADLLLEKGEEVYGTYRWTEDLNRIKHIKEKINLIPADLLDLSSLIRALADNKPDYIFHLAAQSYVPDSFTNPIITVETNTIGTVNLLEAIRLIKEYIDKEYDPIIHVCSSSEFYGKVNEDELPITEDHPMRPGNQYAVGKVGADAAAYFYYHYYGLKVIRTRMFTHSVSRWTPVILRMKDKLIDIKYISEIKNKELDSQIWDMERENIEVWNDGKWTKILQLSCHPINNNKMLEITCRGGTVDTTDNHSIIAQNGVEVEAKRLKKEDAIKITKMPITDSSSDCILKPDEETALLYGLFVAEGDFGLKRMFRIANKDRSLLEKAAKIISRKLGYNSVIRKEKDGMLRLQVLNCSDFVKKNYDKFYAVDKNKRIPIEILNASKYVKEKFLEGYNFGDGDNKHKIKSKFYRFKTKSPILAMGLCFLCENLGFTYKIHVEHRQNKRYYEIRLLNQLNTKNGRWMLKPNNEIFSIKEIPYEGEVWDFETKNHWFNAGIGGLIVHNTGARRTMMSAECNFAKQIALIEKGKQPPIIKHGNLNSVRTWADVRDAVKAYYELVRKCKPGEVYNIGGKTVKSIGEMLDYLISLSTEKENIKKELDLSLVRKVDVNLQVVDVSKFENATGWKPEYTFEQTMQALLNYWRENV